MAKISTLVDPFNTPRPDLYNGIDGANPSIVGGRLQLVIPAVFQYPSIETVLFDWDLIGSAWSIRVVQVPTVGTTSIGLFLEQRFNDTNWVRWDWSNSNAMSAVYAVENVATVVGEVPYQPGMYVRIRENGGLVFWDWSLEGKAWTNTGSWAHTINLTSTHLNLYAGYWNSSDPNPTAPVLLDDLNVLPATVIQRPVGQVAETGAVLGVGRRKRRGLGQLIGSSTVQPAKARKVRVLGQPAEAATLLPVRAAKTKQVGVVWAADAVRPVAARKTRAAGLTAGAEMTLSVGARKRRPLGLLTEVGTVLPVNSGQPNVIGLVEEAGTPLPVRARKTRAVGQLVEVGAPLPLGRRARRAVGAVSETCTVLGAGRGKRSPLGLVVEQGMVLPVVQPGVDPLPGARTRVLVDQRRKWVST